jgi:N-acylglucosamine-6-phosphate 2-epimerase
MNPLTRPLPSGLIVSCQAYEGDPLFGAQIMAAMARAAEAGGAVAIRANSPEDIAAIRTAVRLPIIGLWKIYTPGSDVYITPTRAHADALAAAGADMIAVDATPRPRAGGETLAQLIAHCHDVLNRPVMADVSCLSDAQDAERFGADVISSTMAGYTAHGRPPTPGPDLDFVRELVAHCARLIVAEGRYADPADTARAIALGARAVVVGAAITRPEVITARFAAAIAAAHPI